jgi:3-hydroxy-3-methylglutaryl CoA synthase
LPLSLQPPFQAGKTGFSIGTARKVNALSLVIGPGAGYNLVSYFDFITSYCLNFCSVYYYLVSKFYTLVFHFPFLKLIRCTCMHVCIKHSVYSLIFDKHEVLWFLMNNVKSSLCFHWEDTFMTPLYCVYIQKSNPLPEVESPTQNSAEPKKHSKFQERIRAERESFKAVFDGRRPRIGLNVEED